MITKRSRNALKVGSILTGTHLCSSSVGICKMYEEHLRQMHPHNASITYDISQLFEFVDSLVDLSCLV